jgi:hypothetical protein
MLRAKQTLKDVKRKITYAGVPTLYLRIPTLKCLQAVGTEYVFSSKVLNWDHPVEPVTAKPELIERTALVRDVLRIAEKRMYDATAKLKDMDINIKCLLNPWPRVRLLGVVYVLVP